MSCPGTWHMGVPGGAPAVDRWAASKLTKGSILPALPAPPGNLWGSTPQTFESRGSYHHLVLWFLHGCWGFRRFPVVYDCSVMFIFVVGKRDSILSGKISSPIQVVQCVNISFKIHVCICL